jgi:hypothetical protein
VSTGTDPGPGTAATDHGAGYGDATTALHGGSDHGGDHGGGDDGDNAFAMTRPIPRVPADPSGAAPGPADGRRAPRGTFLIAVALGVGVSVGLGAYSRFHEATGAALNLVGFSSGLAAKAWIASLAFVFVVVQLVSALRMYGKLGRGGARSAFVHRWSGRLAVLVTVPVAVHCLYALGFQDFDTRVLVHSVAGCFFYGAFAAKMVLVSRDGAPRWALPLFGGLVFTVLTTVWLTSSVWFFGTSGLTF